ncbi:MAG: tRNA threonylcarbamoyladenosine dehydratase [Castellaniella sp.]
MFPESPVDLERRFGGLQRLFGPQALTCLEQAHVLVAGIGGVGSWCAEALARSGVGRLTLVDMDHVAESNLNRQLHALESTLGQAKIGAMAARIRDINPQCRVDLVDDFVSPGNVAALLRDVPDVIVDCTDQVQAKVALVLEARRSGSALIMCGGAGGKTDVLTLRGGDLAHAVQDALLARVRHVLRRHHGFPAGTPRKGRATAPRMGIEALWVAQETRLPAARESFASGATAGPQGLSCAGYGSLVTVTAGMGMAAAGQALARLLASS